MKNWPIWILVLLGIFTAAAAAQGDWLSGGAAYYHSSYGSQWLPANDVREMNGYQPTDMVRWSYSGTDTNKIYMFDGSGNPKGYFDRGYGKYYYYGSDYNGDPWFEHTALPFLRDNFNYQFSADRGFGYLKDQYWNGKLQDWFGYRALSNWKANEIQHNAFYNNVAYPLVANKSIGQMIVIP